MANKELTKRQKETMAKHKKHHTAKHIKEKIGRASCRERV